jgi:transcriptional regulator with XRE-family HTH domain
LPGVTEGGSDIASGAVEVEHGLGEHIARVKHAQPDPVNRVLPLAEYNSLSVENDCGEEVKLAQLVKMLREAHGLSQDELGRRIGVSKAAISSIEIGRTKSLRGTTLTGLARELGTTPEELTGKRALHRVKGSGPSGPTIRIAVLGTAAVDSSGTWDVLKPDLKGFLDFESEDDAAYSVRVVSDSLHPRVKSGEFIVCEPGHEVAPGDEVVVKMRNGRSLVREYVFERDGQIAFNGINNGAGRMTVFAAEVESIHYIAAIVKASRYHES